MQTEKKDINQDEGEGGKFVMFSGWVD